MIATIRKSKNKSNAIDNLVEEYAFTFEQAKAIVELQLYRLTNTDILDIEERMKELAKNMHIWTQILEQEEALKYVMKTELKQIKKEYATPRRTEIKDEVTEIKIDLKSMIPKENVVVIVTKEGYVKRVSLKAYQANNEEPTMKPGDYITNIFDVTTLDHLLFFTNLGNYLFLPVHKIPETKWKELGKHINNIVSLSPEEKVISSCIYNPEEEIISVTKNGMIKRTKASEYEATRISKAMTSMKLKEKDEVINTLIATQNILLVSKNGYYCKFQKLEVPLIGVRGSGVKAMNLKDDEIIAVAGIKDEEYITVFTNKNTAKRIKITELEETGRAKRGSSLIKKVKSSPYEITNVLTTSSKADITVITEEGKKELKNSEIPIMDLQSTGSTISKKEILATLKVVEIEKKEIKTISKEEQQAFELNDFKL